MPHAHYKLSTYLGVNEVCSRVRYADAQARPASAKAQKQEASASDEDRGMDNALAVAEEEWSTRLQSALAINHDLEDTVTALQKQAHRMRKYGLQCISCGSLKGRHNMHQAWPARSLRLHRCSVTCWSFILRLGMQGARCS